MKVLITGGAGFIGFHLAKNLIDNGYNVTILDNLKRGKKDIELLKLLEHKNISFIKADITERDTTSKLDKGYDQIYHLASINGTENFYKIPHEVIKVGIVGILNILDWFVESKRGKILLSSTCETYAGALKLLGDKFPIPTPEEVPLVIDEPMNVRWSYGGTKILSEIAMHSYAQVYNIKNFSIIRYHNIYGPRMGFEHVMPNFIEKIIKKESPFIIYGGEETRTFCYVDDGVDATKIIMESNKTNNTTTNIGRSDEEIKIIELAKIMLKLGKHNVKIKVNPAPAGCVKRRCPNVEKLQSLGFKPKVSLKEGIKKTFNWYKDKF